MSRVIRNKRLDHTTLASNYGGWIYCDGCKQTIGYLCYANYDAFSFHYMCKCGNVGSMAITMEDGCETAESDAVMPIVKNRLCCPEDQSPLVTIRDVNLASYRCEISCHTCHTAYQKEMTS